MERKILECSSAGDDRFSAFFARVRVFGKWDTIERHYQLSKRRQKFVPKTVWDLKGQKITHFHVNGKDYDPKHLSEWYSLLWVEYLDKNPELADYASQFDDFSDKFKGKNTVNCQADVIRKYVKEGRGRILEKCKEFLSLMRGNA